MANLIQDFTEAMWNYYEKHNKNNMTPFQEKQKELDEEIKKDFEIQQTHEYAFPLITHLHKRDKELLEFVIEEIEKKAQIETYKEIINHLKSLI